MCVDHYQYHGSQGIETEGHRSRVKVGFACSDYLILLLGLLLPVYVMNRGEDHTTMAHGNTFGVTSSEGRNG